MSNKSRKTKTPRFFNRELSWLDFNRRVLNMALDTSLPLLERLKFLAITSSNLDEFTMIRVGGLKLLRRAMSTARDPSGLTPTAQLQEIDERVRKLFQDQYRVFLQEIEPGLEKAGLRKLPIGEVPAAQFEYLQNYFAETVFPVVTPLAIDPEMPHSPLAHLRLTLAFRLQVEGEEERAAFIALPQHLPRHIALPDIEGFAYVLLEDLVTEFAQEFFPGETIVESTCLRLTRNGDIEVQDDEADDLAKEMESMLVARQRSDIVRIEIAESASKAMRRTIDAHFDTSLADVFDIPGPLDLSATMGIANARGFAELKVEEWHPQNSPQIDPQTSIFETIAQGDVLLFHPYENFEPVIRLVEEAADDPDVIAIKQILYRASRQSRIVNALIRAARKGKLITVVIELKARFDEAHNLGYAEDLENAGIQVIYGVKGLKTHAKACLVVRRESRGIQRYIHYGTGNYNESTARLYTDISYLTAKPQWGADASAFFNALTGYSQLMRFQKIAVAPHGLRKQLLEHIEGETQRARQGQPSKIMAKMNSLADTEIIEALYKAANAGVKILLNVRGICCLRPSAISKGHNIKIISIIDRYLEHARIFYFHRGGNPSLNIASADWMTRNLDKRVELLVPIEEKALKKRLTEILQIYFQDNVSAYTLRSDGTYQKRTVRGDKKRYRAQEDFYANAQLAVENKQREENTSFQPHLPVD